MSSAAMTSNSTYLSGFVVYSGEPLSPTDTSSPNFIIFNFAFWGLSGNFTTIGSE